MSRRWGWTVLTLVFVDEVLAVVALGYVGGRLGAWPLAIVLMGAAVALWGLFSSPKARWGGPVLRPVVKVVVFGAACLGLLWAGHGFLALLLLIFSLVVNALAATPQVRALLAESGR